MKYFRILSVLFLSIILAPATCGAQEKTNRLEVIDFHSTHRCVTCETIEANTKHTLETYFSDELKSGLIVFKVINVDEKENEDIAREFEASGTALFLHRISSDNKEKTDLTNFAFMNARNIDAFSEKLKDKIKLELNKL